MEGQDLEPDGWGVWAIRNKSQVFSWWCQFSDPGHIGARGRRSRYVEDNIEFNAGACWL